MKKLEKIFEIRANRLRQARSFTGLSLSKFCHQSQITYFTYRLWESGVTQLTEKNATICCRALKNHGINCSIKWLLYGLGDAPKIKSIKTIDEPRCESELDIMTSHPEIKAFSKISEKTFICKVANDDAAPFFNKNDLLGCVEVNDCSKISKLDNCLVKYYNDDIFHIRKVCYINNNLIVMPLSLVGDFESFSNNETVKVLAKIVLHRVSNA